MSNKYKRKLQKRETKLWQDIVLLLPVLFGLCIVPMIVLTHDYTIDFTQFEWFNKMPSTGQIDSFGYSKSVALTIVGIATVFFFCYYYWKQINKYHMTSTAFFANIDKKIAILLGIHLIMVIISSVTSKYSELAYNGGGYTQWQTMWVLLAYGILFFYTYAWVTSARKINILIYGLIIHTALMSFIGFMQSIDQNPLLWDWVQKIITKYSTLTGISFKAGYSSVVMTFPNPNYTGTYIALTLPIVVMFIFLKVSDKNWISVSCKLIGVLIAAGFIKSLIGSGSTAAGMTLAFVSVVVIVLLIINYFDSQNKIWWISLAGILILGIVSIFDLDITIPEESNATFTITDSSGKNIPLTYDNGLELYTPNDPRFNMLTLESKRYAMDTGIHDAFTLCDTPNQISFTFVYDNNEWKYYTPYGKLIKLKEVEHFGFKNSENIANRRGYIWSRTIPLMKTYWFKGIGPNAFIIAFPNADFVGSKRVGGSTLLVDKPHNTFLQTYIQTGGISAISYAALCIIYMLQSLRLLWRKKLTNNLSKIAFGLFTASLSYTIVGLTNDAIVGVQSSYWILLGLGFAVNRMLKIQKSETV